MPDAAHIAIGTLEAIVLPWVMMALCLIPAGIIQHHHAKHMLDYPDRLQAYLAKRKGRKQ